MNELLIYGIIGDDYWDESTSAIDVKRQLDAMPAGDLTVRINSPGGSVFDGFAIFNLINQREGETTVYIDGVAASAASVIAMAGNQILMADNALFMIHDPFTISAGSADDMRQTADLLDKVKDSIILTYSTQSNLEQESIAEMMAAETWFNATEALEAGFITGTIEGQATVSNLVQPWIVNGPRADQIPQDAANQTAWRLALNHRRFHLID